MKQSVNMETISWKEKYPSFVMNVVGVSIKEFENKNYLRADNFTSITLEGKDGQRIESEISKKLSKLIVPNKKYKIWYNFLTYPSGLLNGSIEILCAEVE